MNTKKKKESKDRFSDYYNITQIQKHLYQKGKQYKNHNRLYHLIIQDNNIKFALKRISNNTGRNTPGPDSLTFNNLKDTEFEKIKTEVIKRFEGETKAKGRKVYIPKANGKMRPLGITNIYDRLAQQCVYNILEPIVEAQFYNSSMGFRRNFNTKNAIAKIANSMNSSKDDYYMYDCDLSSYFDEVEIDLVLNKLRKNHKINDTKTLKVIKRLMWIDVAGEKYNGKGLRQGSILGPILANVMLHDFEIILNEMNGINNDIEKGREIGSLFKTQKSNLRKGREHYFKWTEKHQFRAVRMYRYADDFIMFSNNKYDLYDAIFVLQEWLKDNNLRINNDKTKMIRGSKEEIAKIDFLGYKVTCNHGTNKGIVISVKDPVGTWKKTKGELTKALMTGRLSKIKSILQGFFNYYDICTNLSWFISRVDKLLYSMSYRKRGIIDIECVKDKNEGNHFILSYKGNSLKINLWELRKRTTCSYSYYSINEKRWEPGENENIPLYKWVEEYIEIKEKEEWNSSLYTLYAPGLIKKYKKEPVLNIDYTALDPKMIDIHHIKPRSKGGTDDFNNLVPLHKESHRLIHSSETCNNQMVMKYRKKTM